MDIYEYVFRFTYKLMAEPKYGSRDAAHTTGAQRDSAPHPAAGVEKKKA